MASSFVGREEDFVALGRRLDDGRLVTIVGPGGIGKTRLAIRFAEQRVPSFTAHRGGGVWFCDLSEARGPGDISATVAAALGAKLEADEGDVGLALARRGRVLIVLDNFDRLTQHAPATLGEWLRVAPSARFLVTSRTALDLMGEQTWSLSPLSLDEAVDLFIRRASEVQPRFSVSSTEVVSDVVDAIDRIPLAIELAATRMSLLTVSQLRDRLVRPLDVLTGRREASRHASMRRTVLDSLELLEPAHQQLFTACAVMRNGFTLDAAEFVMGDVFDGLDALARSSLLRVDIDDDVARYALFEIIREVASERLAVDPSSPALRGRHAKYYASWCARFATNLGLVDRELENLLDAQRTAVSLARADGGGSHARDAATLALAVGPLLSARGRARVLDGIYVDALEVLDASASAGDLDLARAQILVARGLVRRELGETTSAVADFERGLLLARTLGPSELAASALTRLGEASDVAGNTESARARFAEALALLDAAPRSEARALIEAEAYLRVGHARRREGRLPDARAAVIHAADRYRELGRDEGLALSMYELAVVEMFAGESDAALRHFDEGLRVARRGDARVAVGALLTARGCLLQDLGRLDEALKHHADAAGIFHDAGSRYREASALYYLASSYFERGEPEETLAILRRAHERLVGVGAARYEALIAGCTSIALAALGRLAEADAAILGAEAAAAAVRDEPALACNVRLHQLSLAVRKRSGAGAADAIAEAERLVRQNPSDDTRFALRALRGVVATNDTAHDDGALVVYRDGSGFRLPNGTHIVELPDKSPLRRILRTFAERRLSAPGEAVTLDDIIGAGWPSERIGTDAALNRVHVALASLRKLGLRALLVHGSGGYLLSQAVLVRMINRD